MTSQSDSLSKASDQLNAESSAEVVEYVGDDHFVWDRVGIIGSALCVIHCLALAVFASAISLAGVGFLTSELIHQVLAVVLFAVALLAFIPGFRHHRKLWIPLAGAAGVVLLLATGFVLEPFLAHHVEIALTVTGSITLMGAHIANWRLCRNHDHCSAHHD